MMVLMSKRGTRQIAVNQKTSRALKVGRNRVFIMQWHLYSYPCSAGGSGDQSRGKRPGENMSGRAWSSSRPGVLAVDVGEIGDPGEKGGVAFRHGLGLAQEKHPSRIERLEE